MQSLVPDPRADYRGVVDAMVTIFRHEGIRNTTRGIGAVVGGAGPAHALYFACYEHLKKVFSGGHQGNHMANGNLTVIRFPVINLEYFVVFKYLIQVCNISHGACICVAQ